MRTRTILRTWLRARVRSFCGSVVPTVVFRRRCNGHSSGRYFRDRNIANMVVHSDMNMLSVLDYAVNILKVKHIIVCGHYGCGGVKAAMDNKQYGLVDNWLRFIKDVYQIYASELDKIKDPEAGCDRFVELTVREQVFNLTKTSITQNAWRGRHEPRFMDGSINSTLG